MSDRPNPDDRIRELTTEVERLRESLRIEKEQSLEWIRLVNRFAPFRVRTPEEFEEDLKNAIPFEVVMKELEAIHAGATP